MKGEQTAAELASRFGGHPTMIHQWKRAPLEGASGMFDRGSRRKPDVDEAQLHSVRAKISELAIANDFLSRNLKLWGRT